MGDVLRLQNSFNCRQLVLYSRLKEGFEVVELRVGLSAEARDILRDFEFIFDDRVVSIR